MGDVHYMISEAAKHVGVESHVLRYWEEELDLPIGRTEMGHRHYTEEDIQLFSCIKELKEQGLLLKEIKQLLPDMLRTKALLKARKSDAPKAAASINEVADPQDPALSVYTADNLSLSVYQPLLEESLRKILLENNQILEGSLGKSVSEKVTKEMDFLLQAKERLEEDRYRKLDHLLRQQQKLQNLPPDITCGNYLAKPHKSQKTANSFDSVPCLFHFIISHSPSTTFRSELANFVYCGSHVSVTVPIGPFLCLAIMISASLTCSVSLL